MYPRKIQGSSVLLTDNSPLWCIARGTPARGKMWKVLNVGVQGMLADAAIVNVPPASGLFVVPANSPTEQFADVNNPFPFGGVPFLKRGMPLNTYMAVWATINNPNGGNLNPALGPNYLFCMALVQDNVFVYEGETVLCAALTSPGSAQTVGAGFGPGPGAGSLCEMFVYALEGRPEEFV